MAIVLCHPPQEKFRRGMSRLNTLRQQWKEDLRRLGMGPYQVGSTSKHDFAVLLRSL
jgi:hypothetical protein